LERLNAFMASRQGQPGTYGVNLIVQRSNFQFEKHLRNCVDRKVPVYITSLGNPTETIAAAHGYGAKVFCDVTNLVHAEKCARNGCDGFIAVGQGAGGHAGPYPLSLLVRTLKKHFPSIPVLAAGGIADGNGILSALASGASLAYCGTRFIATTEAPVGEPYKEAVVQSGMDRIVMTERISGTPCTVIRTPFVDKIGLKQNRFERWLGKNPKTRKYFKMLVQKRGFSWLEDAIKPGNYNNLWCAGQSVELIHDVVPVRTIVDRYEQELQEAWTALQQSIQP
jgi:nitronate monooxygenase